jgi:hypothetical protein
MEILIKQLDELLAKYSDMQRRSQHNDLSDLPKVERQSLVTRSLAAIHRIAGNDSTYSKEVNRILEDSPQLFRHTSSILGITHALREDLNDGYIKSLIEIIHADIFADFLDMAYHLQSQGYKDAAAVITGSTLESHIKELAAKHGIDTENNGKPVKVDKLNADLAKSDAYSKLDQKNITAWLDLRNKAAHGNYEEYTKDQVELLISGVRDFLGRVPA